MVCTTDEMELLEKGVEVGAEDLSPSFSNPQRKLRQATTSVKLMPHLLWA